MIYQTISIAGAALILAAFAAHQTNRMGQGGPYQWLNLLGGICLFIAAGASRQYGFILLEGS